MRLGIWKTVKDKAILKLLKPQCSSNQPRSWEQIWRCLSEILWMCSLEPCQTFSINTLRHIATNTKRNHCYLQALWRNNKAGAKSSLNAFNQACRLLNTEVSDEKEFDVQQHFNSKNDWIWSQTVNSEPRTVTQKQGVASVLV